MVKFSKEFNGTILPRNHLGSLLNAKREAADVQLEIKKGDSCRNMVRYDNLQLVVIQVWSSVFRVYADGEDIKNPHSVKQFMCENHSISSKL